MVAAAGNGIKRQERARRWQCRRLPDNACHLGRGRYRLPAQFFQALHQGRDIIPLDIMVPLAPTGLSRDANWHDSHNILVANAIAQAEALPAALRMPQNHIVILKGAARLR